MEANVEESLAIGVVELETPSPSVSSVLSVDDWISRSISLERHVEVANSYAFKRILDVAGAVVALLLLSPLFFIAAIAIRIDSPGPIVFTQTRIGRGGRPFQVLKLRTMSADAESERASLTRENIYSDNKLFKIKNDPRVTRVGRFLRRASIDELPQLFNVLRGEMSLVGPRPPLPIEVLSYEPRHFIRLSVVPGMTGPWQVGGRNLVTDFDEIVSMEQRYIETQSIRADCQILLRTIPVVLGMKGAQ